MLSTECVDTNQQKESLAGCTLLPHPLQTLHNPPIHFVFWKTHCLRRATEVDVCFQEVAYVICTMWLLLEEIAAVCVARITVDIALGGTVVAVGQHA